MKLEPLENTMRPEMAPSNCSCSGTTPTAVTHRPKQHVTALAIIRLEMDDVICIKQRSANFQTCSVTTFDFGIIHCDSVGLIKHIKSSAMFTQHVAPYDSTNYSKPYGSAYAPGQLWTKCIWSADMHGLARLCVTVQCRAITWTYVLWTHCMHMHLETLLGAHCLSEPQIK